MIDAYEIGIQLALQDDVSAGLQVINRGLAEVDKAIEATSARLINLSMAAQAAVGAATAGTAMRSIGGAGRVEAPARAEAGEPTKQSTTTQSSVTAELPLPETASPGFIDAAGTKPVQPSAPVLLPETSTSATIAEEMTGGLPTSPAPAEPASAPSIVHVHHSVETLAPPNLAPRNVTAEPSLAPSVRGTASPVSMTSVEVAPSAVPGRAAAPVPNAKDKSFTASVMQATAPASVNQNGSASLSPVPASPVAVESARTATAPWSGVETRSLSARPSAAAERPVAPQVRQEERNDGPGGDVMLDGHLVGYWLAEQMAREASRPPSGTSFFDPRQTPAWSASGSL